MNATKVQIKLYADEGQKESLESYIPVFHRWIQKSTLDEMVFDVADYTHVPRGTGVLLVGHASDYAIDEGEGRPGLLYSRKRDLPEGSALVTDGLSRALKASKLIGEESDVKGPRSFGTKEVLFRFPDRLHVSNDDAGFEAVKPAVESALKELLPGASYSLSREGQAREPLTVRAKA
jgi:hypothetical protein